MPAQRPWLLMVAAPKEVRAVLDALCPEAGVPEIWGGIEHPHFVVVRSGVGKASAAGATARWYDPDRFSGVISVGLGGSLPNSGLRIGDVVLGDPSFSADEGVGTPDGFLDLSRIGFGEDAPAVRPDPTSRDVLAGLVDRTGGVATVSTCSGTDARANELAERTGALAEAMEGAAVGMVVRRLHPDARFAEIRVISNRTGDREHQGWDLAGALGRMRDILGPCLGALKV